MRATGDSIAVNGVCLTLTGVTNDTFTVDVVAETLGRTSLGRASARSTWSARPRRRPGSAGTSSRATSTASASSWTAARTPSCASAPPPELARYLVEKGSVAVDGISLTVVEAAADSFTVALIPTTLARTTLGRTPIGEPVNLEVDVVARYVERLLMSSR